jgi:TolB-like protein/DNA-binding winged helix-turn-helix (wHTH) protein
METAEDKRFVYEFGRFRLDPDEKTLFANGEALHLPAKEFETLLLLVEHNGRAMSKEEMMSALWQDAFVEESNLAKQISRLRKILNSSGVEFIETIPKHGYRFKADLKTSIADTNNPILLEKHKIERVRFAFDAEAEQKMLPAPTRPFIRRWSFVAAAIVLLIGAAAVLVWRQWPAKHAINTIAVLPLRALSGDGDKAFALGLTDALITKLGSVKHFVVRPISSVRAFEGVDEDAVAIGRKLNVDAVLDGSIQESDGRLRINARLINTATGEQIWAEKFDDSVTNIFEVQDRISEQAARALTATLTAEPVERFTKRYTEDPAAFDAYLKGRYYWNKRTEPDFRRAVGYFDQAVALDQNFGLAYSGLADCYILLAVWGTEPPNISLPKAKDAAMKALAADPDLAEARTSLAFIKWVYDWDFIGAESEFAAAAKLNPNYATAHHWYSYYLVSMGRGNEAIAEIKRAQELEGPLSLGIMTDVGEIYCWAGQYDKALENLKDVIEREPNYSTAHYEIGIAYLKKGMIQEATREFERARDLENIPRNLAVLAYAYGSAGEVEKAKQIISELEAKSKTGYVSPFSIAIAHAGLGENDVTIDWLEKAYAERSDAMAIINVHPLLTTFHSDPRFADLLKRVGYSE